MDACLLRIPQKRRRKKPRRREQRPPLAIVPASTEINLSGSDSIIFTERSRQQGGSLATGRYRR